MASGVDVEVQRTAAYRALKALIVRLVSGIPPDAICDILYARSVVSREEYLRATNDDLDKSSRTRRLILALQTAVLKDHALFEEFCAHLEAAGDAGLSEIARRLRERLQEEIERVSDGASVLSRKTKESSEPESLSTLKTDLAVIQKGIYQSDENLEAKHSIMCEYIQRHLKSSLDSGVSPMELTTLLKSLCYEELLVPTKLHGWCFEKLDELCKMLEKDSQAARKQSTGAPAKEPMVPSLFCKEVVYHAALLCDVINQTNAKEYAKFLKKQSTGHYFEEISVSNSSSDDLVTEKYVIAKHEKTLYVAFCGEPHLSHWKGKYTSFEEGLRKQANRIPIRFFSEQLRDSNRIVLTGFSFGALLAISMTANIWKKTYISEDILRKHVICIAFGAPLINLPPVNQVIKEIPKMELTIHLVFIKDDLLPRLLRFTNLELNWSTPFQQSSLLPLPAGNGVKVFQGHFASVCVEQLANLQDMLTETEAVPRQAAGSLKQLKSLLKQAAFQVNASSLQPPPLEGVFHLLHTKPATDTHEMHELTKLTATDELNYLTTMGIDQLDVHLLRQHTMSEYRMKLFKGFIDQGPKRYSPPPLSRNDVPLVKILKPSVVSVGFYRHGDQVAVVLKGNNLWFCQKIQVGTGINSRTVKSLVPNATQRSVQFNYSPKDERDNIIQSPREEVRVCLHSQFAKPLQKQCVKVTCNERYDISVRQSQLAKLTPSELIELAYLSSMLELPSTEQPSSQQPSKRFLYTTAFLENAVRIVPVESICHAITYGDEKCAIKCAEVLLDAERLIPPSVTLVEGLRPAIVRLSTGMTPEKEEEFHLQLARNPPIFMTPQIHFRGTVQVHQAAQTQEPNDQPVMSYSEAVASGSRGAQSLPPQPPPPERMMMQVGVAVIGAPQLTIPLEETECYQQVLKGLESRLKKLQGAYRDLLFSGKIISGKNIDELYPVKGQKSNTSSLLSPIEVLSSAQARLRELRQHAHSHYDRSQMQSHSSSGSSSPLSEEEGDSSSYPNVQMLKTVLDIWNGDLRICASLLGAFMEQQICVPLVNSPQETARAVSYTKPHPSIGVWALFSLRLIDVQQMFGSIEGQVLSILINEYIEGIFSDIEGTASQPDNASRYAAKVQFLLQGMMPTVSCNMQYISYSLERQLDQLCKRYDIKPSTRVNNLVNNWSECFKTNLLSLVMPPFRPLLARWIIWTLNVHQLREGLAAYSTVGIIGLVNSGKSCLLRQLFKMQVLVGTTEIQRTTVPFMYNLDGQVEGLSVIDFPGVDDRDESIASLARLLLTLAQLVILVVDYRKIHTQSAKDWLEHLDKESVPYLVCLTHADKLYANEMMGRQCPENVSKREISRELELIEEKLGQSPNRTMAFYSFSQDCDSSLNSKEGRQKLLKAGIQSTEEVGKWIEDRLRNYLHQDDVANRLFQFLNQY